MGIVLDFVSESFDWGFWWCWIYMYFFGFRVLFRFRVVGFLEVFLLERSEVVESR